MDKKIFNLLMEYQSLENKLYWKLDKIVGMEKAEELVSSFTDLHEKTLKIGKYLDLDKYVEKDTYLIKEYEQLGRYHKMHVIYEYDNGLTLCSTTTELIYLIPKDHLAEY